MRKPECESEYCVSQYSPYIHRTKNNYSHFYQSLIHHTSILITHEHFHYFWTMVVFRILVNNLSIIQACFLRLTLMYTLLDPNWNSCFQTFSLDIIYKNVCVVSCCLGRNTLETDNNFSATKWQCLCK